MPKQLILIGRKLVLEIGKKEHCLSDARESFKKILHEYKKVIRGEGRVSGLFFASYLIWNKHFILSFR